MNGAPGAVAACGGAVGAAAERRERCELGVMGDGGYMSADGRAGGRRTGRGQECDKRQTVGGGVGGHRDDSAGVLYTAVRALSSGNAGQSPTRRAAISRRAGHTSEGEAGKRDTRRRGAGIGPN